MNKVILKNVQLSYPALFEPDAFGDAEPRYKATLIFTDRTNVSDLEEAVEAAIQDKWGSDRPHPSRLKTPIKDGNTKIDSKTNQPRAEFADKQFMTAKSKHRPIVVGPNPSIQIEDPMQVYPGAEANVVVQIATYDNSFGTGLTCYLGSVQLTGKGETFLSGGDATPESEFADLS